MIEQWHDPWIFTLCILIYILFHVSGHYMGYHGKTWDLRKNHKKVKKNRTLL